MPDWFLIYTVTMLKLILLKNQGGVSNRPVRTLWQWMSLKMGVFIIITVIMSL